MFKVLIVDDMSILRRDIKRQKIWGEQSGFFIGDEAKDGQEALQKLKQSSFDLVITDIKMPHMDGIELLKNISEKRLCPCVVLLSDYTEYGYARQSLILGAFDYIGKPIDENELSKLLDRVRQHLFVMRKKEESFKYLEGIVIEKFEAIFPDSDVKQITELICNGDSRAVESTAHMVQILYEALDYDIKKTTIVIKKALNEIIEETVKYHEWINAFENISTLKKIDFYQCEDLASIQAIVQKAIENLIHLVIKFSHCNESNFNIKQTCKYILEHLEDNISVKQASESLYINKAYISNLFKQNLGISLLEYLTMIKMERAKKMLRDGFLKNYEIACRLGFMDIEYFSRLFKKHTGMSPVEYRQQKDSKM